METTTKQIEFTRISNDSNGNPRYVCHFLNLINEGDRIAANSSKSDIFGIETEYNISLNKARKIGGRKFHNKQYGGGIVFQSYNIADTEARINELIEVNTDFKKDWSNKEINRVKKAIYNHLSTHNYKYKTDHVNPAKPLNFFYVDEVDNLLGLAYTSSGDYAGLWICNGVYAMVNETHHFIGFAINANNEIVGIAEDENENAIYITL